MRMSISRTPRQISKSDISPSPRKSIIRDHRIYNQDKLKVFIKFKPHMKNQLYSDKPNCISYLNQKEVQIQTSINKKIYTFDHVFDPSIHPESVFNVGCSQLIEQVVQGVHEEKANNNGLVFVYGNTGTGKTHTMGLIDQIKNIGQGLVPSALRQIFENNNSVEEVCISFCQIYKDQIYDLLDFEDEKKLHIRQNQKSKQPYIEDLIMIQVKNYQQASQLLNIGLEKRRVAEQKVNNRSSRGHGIITFYLKNHNSLYTGRVSFVDLAGCERIKQSESKGKTLNEALFINTSLSALQTLLMNISDQNVRSYRSNKLTRLLQPYFQFGKIRLFVTSNYQSIQSIQFAKRCKGIKFHQRQVKRQTQMLTLTRTPKKGQQMKENLNQKLQVLKKEFANKQNCYLKCISNLVSLIQKIHDNISGCINNQSIHSSFSLPELFQHIPLQSKVNAKIKVFEKKQEQIVNEEKDGYFSKISSKISTNVSQIYESIDTAIEKTQQIIKNSQEVGFTVIRRIAQLSRLTQYKNVYKKEWFTCEIKNGLLENKNDQFEKAIVYLMEQFEKVVVQSIGNGLILAKIKKKLKQYGINFSNENQSAKERSGSNNGSQNKLNSTKTKTNRKQTISKKLQDDFINETNENSQQMINKSHKRSIIYIDDN